MNKKDSLGDRMKENYEKRTKYMLPRRTNVLIRIDGKAFHTYTRGFDRPIDQALIDDMDNTARYLCENIQGAKFGFVQSDEISIWMSDYDDIRTDAWFDNNLQKICSIATSMATAKFNQLRMKRSLENRITMGFPIDADWVESFELAEFDARVFVIPELEEVKNYFIWRQQDATRNSVSMAAQSIYSHKQLQGKNNSEMQDMMMEKGINWNDYQAGFKRGRCIKKIKEVTTLEYKLNIIKNKKIQSVTDMEFAKAVELREQETKIAAEIEKSPDAQIIRNKWEILDPPIFTQDREFIRYDLLREIK